MIFRQQQPDPIEEETRPKPDPEEQRAHRFQLRCLTDMQLRFVSAWTGNLIAAARAAGYSDPKGAAYKLMKEPHVVEALQQKQESMLRESGEHLARTLPLCRADVIDRLWQLAQLNPERTNGNITGQVKAAQSLEQIFALNIDENDLLKRQLEGRSEEELEFYVVHGFLPHQQPKPAEAPPPGSPTSAGFALDGVGAPLLPESTASSATPEPLSTLSSTSTESTDLAEPKENTPVTPVAETEAPSVK